MLNCFELLFFHINLHSVHHNDKAKTELSQLRKLIKSKKTEIVHCISLHIPLTQYLAEAPLRLKSFWV